MAEKYRFIDLFAGLGGFHLALASLGHECVFASEIKSDLRDLYARNFPDTNIQGDITLINARKGIPPHDILCAGFPCQPFSQAGKRMGFEDEDDRGNLFYFISDILFAHRPKFIILENVSNLMGHDSGNTWKVIESTLRELNYDVKATILSPHQFGLSQHRKRVFIVGINKKYGNLNGFEFGVPDKNAQLRCDVRKVVIEDDTEIIKLKPDTRHQLDVWEEFVQLLVQHNQPLPTFPIWAMEFGATYDYETTAPAHQTVKNIIGKRGILGRPIIGSTLDECLSQLPVYARTNKDKEFPLWKKRYISQNREFYRVNKRWLDSWLEKIKDFDNSHMKFEWNCGIEAKPTLFDKVIQFRASGIRVKLPTFIPALNLVGTQIPILPWVKLPESEVHDGEPQFGRYLSVKEGLTLQGMTGLELEGLTTSRKWEALGNAVNATLVKRIAKQLFNYYEGNR